MPKLITGAGSSIDIHSSFQSGHDLLKNILMLVTNDTEFRRQLTSDLKIERNIIESFRQHLFTFRLLCPRKTIDEFLGEVMLFPEYDKQSEDWIIIGKMAIFYSILLWEHNYLIKTKTGPKQNNWVDIFKPHFDGTSPKIHHEPWNVFTFNYDRLVEYILSEQGKRSIDSWNRIIHVYGTIEIKDHPFGLIPTDLNALQPHLGNFIIANDRVIHNQTKTSNVIGFERIVHQLSPYNYIFGFGFDYFNCRNLGLLDSHGGRKFIGNIHGTSDDSETFFKHRREETDRVRHIDPAMQFKYMTCTDFVQFAMTNL